jgi:enoyl-CoA hydratase/carnithine racemase
MNVRTEGASIAGAAEPGKVRVEFEALSRTKDAHEGPRAFMEKREPVWAAS